MDIKQINHLLGNIDIYLLDQILKDRFDHSMRILDAGCGEGRNTHFFIQEGYQIFGVDIHPMSIQMARMYARTLDRQFDPLRFQVAPVEELPFHSGAFDVLISSAVMHFARDKAHFLSMFSEQMRVLKSGGIFWLRMCSDAGGLFKLGTPTGEGRKLLPDGTERFILNEKLTKALIREFHLNVLEPPKSVVVHGQRAMGTYVFQKGR
ncbi:MAG: class I SAM-dependent methyltransferase [Cyclobacteriaceae bacterium]